MAAGARLIKNGYIFSPIANYRQLILNRYQEAGQKSAHKATPKESKSVTLISTGTVFYDEDPRLQYTLYALCSQILIYSNRKHLPNDPRQDATRLSSIYGDTSHYLLHDTIYPLPKTSNFRLFQTDRVCRGKFQIVENIRKLSKRVENTVEKGETAHYEQFLLFTQYFLKTWTADM